MINFLSFYAQILIKLTSFTKLEREQMISIVLRSMIFRFTDDEIVKEIQKEFPDKITISKSTLSRLKKGIKTRNMKMYNSMKITQDLFLSKVLEKYQNIDTYIKEYFKIYNDENTSTIIKLKILEKIAELDRIQLRMQQDFPYLEIYHKDARDEIEGLDNDISELKGKMDKDINDTGTPGSNAIINSKKEEQNKIPIESITKDREIQEILMSRTQSGFEGRISRKKL